jgi:hypothetical protein
MYMPLTQFKRMTVDGRSLKESVIKRGEGAVLHKGGLGRPDVLSDRQLRFTISTGVVDRARDVVDQSGWDLSGYRRDPVVLLQHRQNDLPFAKCIDIGLESGNLRATVEFARSDFPGGIGELSETVLCLYKEGFMSATSVGFYPIDWDVTVDPTRGADDWSPGFDFRKNDLTEFSLVTVPCNSEAVIDPMHRDPPVDAVDSLLEIVAGAPPDALRAKTLRRLRLDQRLDRRLALI